MSTGPIPRLLDLRKLCDRGGEINGSIDLNQLQRLREFAGTEAQMVEASLRGFRDDSGYHRIDGVINVRLHLTCQRCLQTVATDVCAHVDLVLVWSQEAARELPEELESWLVEEGQTDVAPLLEEEILLALPLVALHESCQPPINPAKGERTEECNKQENPFSVLAELKKRQD